MQASQPSTQSIVIAPKDTEVKIPQVAAKHAYDRDTDVRELAQDVKKESQSYGTSANIFVAGSAIRQAKIVKELQYAGVTTQILLSPQAVSPIFARTLVAEGGTVSANLTTVGYNMSDSLALQSDDPGRGLAAFLEAVRVMGQDSSYMTCRMTKPSNLPPPMRMRAPTMRCWRSPMRSIRCTNANRRRSPACWKA